MRLGDMIAEQQRRIDRKKQLRARHTALMQPREPESGEAHEVWSREVERVRAEIDAMERLQ